MEPFWEGDHDYSRGPAVALEEEEAEETRHRYD